mmetsp:Transcript_7198/g.21954  ORF Transcript_7198/g.21954 Transcript_7198/m.21954 type:complete len:206 (+) Transcript_7198:454-1071(+)
MFPIEVEFIHTTTLRSEIVELYGSWDDFHAGIAMKSDGLGVFHAMVTLNAGCHLFRFNVDGRWEGPNYGQVVERGDELYGIKLINGSRRTVSCRDMAVPKVNMNSTLPEATLLPSARCISEVPAGRMLSETVNSDVRMESLAEMFREKGVEIGEYYDVKVESRATRRRKGFADKMKSAVSRVSSMLNSKRKQVPLNPNVYRYERR